VKCQDAAWRLSRNYDEKERDKDRLFENVTDPTSMSEILPTVKTLFFVLFYVVKGL